MKNAIIFVVGMIVSILVGVQYGLHQVNKQTDKWDERYSKIDKDVSAFVDVSNPNTIRMYTKELRDILDNMSRLSKIIDKGEEIDLTLARIEKEYMILGEQVKLKVTEIDKTLFVMKEEQQMQGEDINDLFDMSMDVPDKMTLIDNKMMNKFEVIQTDLDTIRNLIKEIQDSKIGKKIFK
jgi:hypothetical protein